MWNKTETGFKLCIYVHVYTNPDVHIYVHVANWYDSIVYTAKQSLNTVASYTAASQYFLVKWTVGFHSAILHAHGTIHRMEWSAK